VWTSSSRQVEETNSKFRFTVSLSRKLNSQPGICLCELRKTKIMSLRQTENHNEFCILIYNALWFIVSRPAFRNRYSDWIWAGRREVGVRVPVKNVPFTTSFRPALQSIQPPNPSFPREQSVLGVKLTTHLQLESKSIKCESRHPLFHPST
jgi:hypothetical protein